MLTAAAKPLPPAVSAAASRTLFNVLGTATSTVTAPAVTTLLAAAAAAGGAGAAPVPGLAATLDPYWAALVTGTAAHLDDFDDTHLATVIHPGAAALATVLSLVPETAPSGAAFLAAFAAGCEAQLRIGNAISPEHYDHGWHITGTCGVFGAAVAASVLLGLDAEAAGRALSLAATMTAGHREAFGSMTKPLHAGKAAANGVLAARLAAAGLAGPPDPLGPGGVLDVLSARVHRQELSGDRPGRGWELELNTFKTYPCGVVAHPGMDAAIAVSNRLDPAEITAVTLRCHPLVPELMGTVQPEDGLRSRFSARHGVAVGLLFGRAGLAEFSDAVATAPKVARLRGLITLDPDPGVARDAAVLRIETRSAGPVEVRVEHTRGSAARPLTDAELLAKVRALADPVLGDAAADRIWQAVDRLPAAPGVSELLACLRPGASGLGVFTASHRRQEPAPNDAASHPRRPFPTPSPGSTTERVLALAADAAPTARAEAELARFAAAVAAGTNSPAARALRALRPAYAYDPPPAASTPLPDGPALTAWLTAAAAIEGSPDETVAMIVCAAARALGDDCAAAIAAGVEAAGLVEAGLAGVDGWSLPVVSAAIGAGLAADLMLGLPEPQLRDALGICATQAAGLRAADGTDAGPLQAGKAAFNAVEAALLARAGFTGPADPLDGRRGLFALFRPAVEVIPPAPPTPLISRASAAGIPSSTLYQP